MENIFIEFLGWLLGLWGLKCLKMFKYVYNDLLVYLV